MRTPQATVFVAPVHPLEVNGFQTEPRQEHGHKHTRGIPLWLQLVGSIEDCGRRMYCLELRPSEKVVSHLGENPLTTEPHLEGLTKGLPATNMAEHQFFQASSNLFLGLGEAGKRKGMELQ